MDDKLPQRENARVVLPLSTFHSENCGVAVPLQSIAVSPLRGFGWKTVDLRPVVYDSIDYYVIASRKEARRPGFHSFVFGKKAGKNGATDS